jgi:DNA-binding NarL/FixJ family response regulator
MSGPSRVLIAERHRLYGVALDAALHDEADFLVVGRAETGIETTEMIATLNPDIVLLDADLPPTGGVDTCAQLKQFAAPRAVMILDDEPRPWVLVTAIEADADGYITRDVGCRAFIAAVRAITRGEVSVPRALQATLVRGLRESRRNHERTAHLYARLTRREREVLELLADGLAQGAVAEVLSISSETVRTHIQNSLSKLEVHSRLEAAAIARAHRLVRRGPIVGAAT